MAYYVDINLIVNAQRPAFLAPHRRGGVSNDLCGGVRRWRCRRPTRKRIRNHAAEAAPLFKEFGASRMVEVLGRRRPDGKLTDFRGAVKAEAGEVVVFSWIEYPSKDTRDAAQRRRS